jgi:multidrug efflux pump subunit AcrB
MARDDRKGGRVETHSPIEGVIRWLERSYGSALGRFVASPKLKLGAYVGLAAALVALATTVLPRLPREIVGTPDTDWMMLGIDTSGNTLLRQMENVAEEQEAKLLKTFGAKIQYTFTQTRNPNSSIIMARLRNKAEMKAFWEGLEKTFTNTPLLNFWVAPWNPSELPIPDPPQMRIAVRGGTLDERALAADDLRQLLDEKQVYPRVWGDPDVSHAEEIILRPRLDLWPGIRAEGAKFLPADIADLSRVATYGRRVLDVPVNGRATEVRIAYPEGVVATEADVASLPIGIGAKLVPLKALTSVAIEQVPPTLYREDGRDLFLVLGKESSSTAADASKKSTKGLVDANRLVDEWRKKSGPAASSTMTVTFEDAEKDMHEALKQLGLAVGLSILLIFLTLVFQFGDIVSSLLVLVAVPLGFIGVLVSLWAFRSTLSLNSVLGVILLNGIAVANSIILVDFLKRLVERGFSPEEAAIEAGRKRLRPILITSMTTILGMLPIALGMGDGGRILQPLGIAVSGGLWVSMGLTLFVVPALQVAYLKRRHAGSVAAKSSQVSVSGELPGLQTADVGQAGISAAVGPQVTGA